MAEPKKTWPKLRDLITLNDTGPLNTVKKKQKEQEKTMLELFGPSKNDLEKFNEKKDKAKKASTS